MYKRTSDMNWLDLRINLKVVLDTVNCFEREREREKRQKEGMNRTTMYDAFTRWNIVRYANTSCEPYIAVVARLFPVYETSFGSLRYRTCVEYFPTPLITKKALDYGRAAANCALHIYKSRLSVPRRKCNSWTSNKEKDLLRGHWIIKGSCIHIRYILCYTGTEEIEWNSPWFSCVWMQHVFKYLYIVA